MQNINRICALIVLSVLTHSCLQTEPTFDEKLETCLVDYLKPEPLSSFKVLDTVFTEYLIKEIKTFESLNEDLLENAAKIEIRKDTAISNLKKAEVAIEEITFDMLIPMAQENIEKWKWVIEKEEENLRYTDSLVDLNKESIDFYKNLKETAEIRIAYYYVSVNVEDTEKRLFVSPKFKVLLEE